MTDYEKELKKMDQEFWEKIGKREGEDIWNTLHEIKEHEEQMKQVRKLQSERCGNKNDNFHGQCDHPNTMENSTATFLWVVVMVVSILFKGGWILCVLETIIWWKFITRHNK